MTRKCTLPALFAVSLTSVLIPAAANAASIDVLVPAYANPCCADGPAMWSSLIATASDPNRRFNLYAIFNPASGPGSQRDPNFLDATGAGPLATFKAAGGIVEGYVATNNATRPIADVEADVRRYLTGFYGGYVNGIFFDEMSNNLANVGYYRELQTYVKSIKPDARTIGNPGSGYVNNPSGQTSYGAADYVGALDTLVTFENAASAYGSSYPTFDYLQGLAPDKVAHMVHTQPAWNNSLLATAASRGAGFLYVTNDVMINPYDTLPAYWPQFTAGVSAFNAAPVPEPSAVTLMLAALGALAWRLRGRTGDVSPQAAAA